MNIDVFTGGYFQTNGYLFVHDGGSCLIDAPEGVADWLMIRGVSPDLLLLTHLHYDHIIDAAAVSSRFGCPIWAHSSPNPDLTLETVLKESIGWPFDVAPFTVDRELAGLSDIESGGMEFALHHVPGHSPDSLCYRPRIGEESGAPRLFGGDVLFLGGIGRTDFPHGNHALLLDGIRNQLYPLPGETIVHPGHGPATTIGRERMGNPFVRA